MPCSIAAHKFEQNSVKAHTMHDVCSTKLKVSIYGVFSQRIHLGSRLRHEIKLLFMALQSRDWLLARAQLTIRLQVLLGVQKSWKQLGLERFIETEKSYGRKKTGRKFRPMRTLKQHQGLNRRSFCHRTILMKRAADFLCASSQRRVWYPKSFQLRFSPFWQTESTQFEFGGRCLAHSDKNWGNWIKTAEV